MTRYSPDIEKQIEDILEPQLKRALQYKENPLHFGFLFKTGHPCSEELYEWVREHGFDLDLSDWCKAGFIDHGTVHFINRPDIAALFKLRYC